MYARMIFTLLLLLSSISSAQRAQIPHGFEDVAVLIERWNIDSRLESHGTGFFFSDSATNYRFLVTNRHLLIGRDSIHIRFNDYYGNAQECNLYRVSDSGKPNWHLHPDTNVDLAFCRIPRNYSFRAIENFRIKNLDQIELGDEIYFIGFPLTERTSDNLVHPLMRHGIVSYIVKDSLVIRSPSTHYPAGTILMDATSLGGNSGGPVISSPKKGTSRASLIGIIQGHLGTKSGENTDLGIVVPSFRINELIAEL